MRSAIEGVGKWLAVAACVAACSGGTGIIAENSGGNCVNVSPCGGNILGTWKVTNVCTTGSSPPPSLTCPDQAVQINVVAISGTLTFNSDGTYSEAATLTESEVMSVPMNCVMSGGKAVSCDQLGTLESSAMDGASVSCAANGPNCDCSLPPRSAPYSAAGTYTTSGTSLTITLASSTPSLSQYCVQGNTLYVSVDPAGMDAGAMGSGNASLTFVATRQ